MEIGKGKFKALICVTLMIFSLFLVVSIGDSPELSSDESAVLLVDIPSEEGMNRLSDFEVIDIYGGKALLRVDKKEKARLIRSDFEINTLPSRTEISIRGHTFNIDKGPNPPPDMKINGYEPGKEGLYLVHFLGPINPEWRQELEKEGVEILNYVPNYAYEVRMTPKQAEGVKDKFFVDWVGLYHSAFRLPEDVETGVVNARFISNPDRGGISEKDLKAPIMNSRELEGGGKSFTLNVSSREELKRWARLDGLYLLSNKIEPELHSEVEAQTIGGGLGFIDDEHSNPDIPYRKYGDFGAYINQLGYSGDGVTVAVADTGLGDGTMGASNHPDLTGRVIGGHSFGETSDWSDGHGHGTHVTGSVAGDSYHGSGKNGTYPGFGDYLMGQGLAYNSDLYSAKIFTDSGSFLLEDDYYPIFEVPKQESDAYVHVNSWGASSSGKYTNIDSVFDRAVRDANRDTEFSEPMVITASAGNAGPVEESTGSPANAKNIITVGATESYMPDGGDYGGIDTERISSIARFSSRGWTEDNRVKPDLVAPGVNVLSLGSPEIYDGATYAWKSGTSMSNPAVAGAASVVVEWYEKRFGERPSPAMVKSLLINTAEDLRGDGCRSEPIPNKDEGWGMVDISKLEYPKEDPIPFSLEDQSSSLQTGESDEYELEPDSEGQPLKITLTWTDKNAVEQDDVALKNDLNLEVTSPSGETYTGNAFFRGWTRPGSDTMNDFDRTGDGRDDVNNVENVYIHPDEVESGTYSIEVDGFDITMDGTNDGVVDQDYALTVYNGESSEMKTTGEDRPENLLLKPDSRPDDNEKLSDYSERDPIHIEGDGEFESKAEQNGWSGDGTEENPFVIEGYTIDGEEEYSPISIEDVDSHFIVRNNRLHNANRSSQADSGNSGLYLSSTGNGRIIDNEFDLNSYGVLLEGSQDNTIQNNIALNNHVGFHLSSSSENNLKNNIAKKISHPVYGQGIYLEDSENNSVLNNRVLNNDEGIKLKNSDENLLMDNHASYNTRGLILDESNENEMIGETISENDLYGLYILDSDENRVLQTDVFNNTFGVYVRSSKENLLRNNWIRDSEGSGIRFFSSGKNRILDNKISNNSGDGISVVSSENHTISDNEFEEDGIAMIGTSVKYWNTHIMKNNTVNGEPIHFLSDVEGDVIENEIGQIILANCTDVVIKDKHIDTGDRGILLGFSDGNEIVNNTVIDQRESIALKYSHGNSLTDNQVYDNRLGLYMVRSKRNTIAENNLSDNDLPGLYLLSSEGNLIFGNKIFNNDIYGLYLINSYDNTIYHNDIYHPDNENLGEQSLAYDTGKNSWDHKSEGNHWSNYEDRYPEAEKMESSGFWDKPYDVMDGDSKDKYPLLDAEPVDDMSAFIFEPGFKGTSFSSDVNIQWASKGVTRDSDISIRLDGDMWIDVNGKTEYIFEELSEGDHTVEVRVEDEDDTSSHSVEFEVNTDVYVEVTKPESSDIEGRSTVTVEWIAKNMEYSEIRLEGENFENTGWIDVGNESEHTFRDLKDGQYSVSVRAVDEEGKIDNDGIGFSVETVGIEIEAPEEESSLNSRDVTVEWTSEHAESHQVSICGGRWNKVGEAEEYELTDLREGQYTIHVRAIDATGRSKEDTVSFTVDVTQPVVRILEPEDGEFLFGGSVELRWEGHDNMSGIERYEVRVEDGEWIEIGEDTEYVLEGLDPGNHTIEVRVWDEAGNSAVDQVKIEMDERSILEILRDNWWVFAIGAVILIILFDKLYWRRNQEHVKGESLDQLEEELGQSEPKSREDEYKL